MMLQLNSSMQKEEGGKWDLMYAKSGRREMGPFIVRVLV